MSKTVLSDLDGFTPVIDILLEQIGLIPALVFGKVWRYCQMKDQICRASQQTIADELRISRRTVVRALDLLVKNGFLEEVHTQTVNHYRDTGKANIGIKIAATVTESHSAERQRVTVENPTVTQSHSGSDTESQCTVTESHTKIVLKKESRKKTLSLTQIDFERLNIPEYKQIPELKLFQDATAYVPPSGTRGALLKLIVKTIREQELAAPEIETAFTQWTASGYKADNLKGWLLEWAPAIKRGERPWEYKTPAARSNGNRPKSLIDAAREYRARKVTETPAASPEEIPLDFPFK